jgi:WxL domain surface cell wall-binding
MHAREMRRTFAIAALVASAALVAVAAARAATVTATATVTAGATLSVAGNGTPTFGLTLNGNDQTTSYTLPIQVIDARGLAVGGGWNVTVTSTQFGDGAGHTLPATASTVTGVTAACHTSSTCTLPTNSVSNSNLALPAGAGPPTAVKFYNAATATGLGHIDANATVSVAVPANTIAATYTSTITVAIAAGP